MKYSRIRWKYRIEEGLAYKLHCKFTIKDDYTNQYFSLTTDGWLLLYTLYAWDGATKFPDFDWIKTPSAIHDALHEAIRLGVIPEAENNLVDTELEMAIGGNPAVCWSKRQLLKIRGWYVRKATNTVDEKRGTMPQVIELPRLQGEIPLSQFHQMRGA